MLPLIVIVSDENTQKLEVGGYDTKPIWEQVIQEIVETRLELSERLDQYRGCQARKPR
jgi:hypothetical protein